MPKANGYEIKVIRKDRETLVFDLRDNGKRHRGPVPVRAIVDLISGKTGESNLGIGAEPITLKEFINTFYLPVDAKTRLPNHRSYKSEASVASSVCEQFGDQLVHEIRTRDGEACREAWLGLKLVNSTVKKRLNCLRRVMEYAVRKELIIENPIFCVKGLPVGNRSHIWLTIAALDRLLAACHPSIRNLVLYLVLTGARVSEALDFRVDDLRGDRLYVPTEKLGRPMREVMRVFKVSELGPRFAALIAQLKPHPKSGFYFYANLGKTTHLSGSYAARRFQEARRAAGLGDDIHLHDLRGTFAMHRSLVVPKFRQLQAEMGHEDPKSMASYLALVQSFDPSESIFYGVQIGEGANEAGGK